MEITGYSISEYIDHINKSGCGYVPSSTFRFRSLGAGMDVNYLGIYNPRLDEVYRIRVCSRGRD